MALPTLRVRKGGQFRPAGPLLPVSCTAGLGIQYNMLPPQPSCVPWGLLLIVKAPVVLSWHIPGVSTSTHVTVLSG